MNGFRMTYRILVILLFTSLFPFRMQATEATDRVPMINIILLDDKAVGMPQGSEIRRNNWEAWRNRLPTFLSKLGLVAEFRRAASENSDPAGSLYGVEVASSLSPDRVEQIVESELNRIHASTKRPSVILAQSSAGKDQLRVVFQDLRDYPPAHAAKFLRVLGEISPAIPLRRIAENFGPFSAPPTLIFDPRIHGLCSDTPEEQLPKRRWGVLEETYLLPDYVLHLVATLDLNVRATADTFYLHSLPAPGTLVGEKFESNLYIAGAGINSPPNEPTGVLQMALLRSARNTLIAPLHLSEWKNRGLGLENPRTATEIRTYASMKARQAQAEGKDIVFDVRPDLAPYLIEKFVGVPIIPRGTDIVDYLSRSPHWKAESELYAIAIDAILNGYKDANTRGSSHGLCHSECGYAVSLTKGHFDSLDLFKVRVGPDMAIPRIERTVREGGAVTLYTGKGDWGSLWNLATKSTAQDVCRRTGCIALHDEAWRWHDVPLGPSRFEVVSGRAPSVSRLTLDPTTFAYSGDKRLTAAVDPNSNRPLSVLTNPILGLGLSPFRKLETGGILFDKGNIYSLDLSGRVRALGDKAVIALDASGGVAGSFKEGEETQLSVGIPMGPGKKRASWGPAGNVLIYQRDVLNKGVGFLPLAISRFWASGRRTSPSSGDGWTFEPLAIQGIENIRDGAIPLARREVTVIPLETGNRLSYLAEVPSSKERGSGDQVGANAFSFKNRGGDFQPDLLVNDDGTFSWVLRHGVVINFSREGFVQEIRQPAGERVMYLRSDNRIVEKRREDGRFIRVEYKQGVPVRATTEKSAFVLYSYDSKRLLKVESKNDLSSMKYDDAGRLSEIRENGCAVRLKYDSQAQMTSVTAPRLDLGFEEASGGSMLRISDPRSDAVEWHFRPNQSLAGVTRKNTGILWTRSSDGRIIQMALGTITPMKDGRRFEPTVLVGTLP